MKINTELVLSAAGIGLAVVAIAAGSRSSGSAPASDASSGGIPASALVSETNTYNNDAAAVEGSIVQAEAGVLQSSITTRGAVIGSALSAAQGEVGTIENAQTARFNTAAGYAANEYDTYANNVTQELGYSDALAANENNNQTQLGLAQIEEPVQLKALGVAKDISNNQTTDLRIGAGAAKAASLEGFLGNLVNGLTSIFTFGAGKNA